MITSQGGSEEIWGTVWNFLRQGQLLTKQRTPEGGKFLSRQTIVWKWKCNILYIHFQKLKTGNLNNDIIYSVNRAGSVRNLIFYLWHAEAGFGTWRSIKPVFFLSLKGKVRAWMSVFLSSCHLTTCVLDNWLPRGRRSSLLCWRAASLNSHSQLCSVGVQFCSGVRFQQLFSDVLDLFEAYFYSDLCCSWLLLDAFTAHLAKNIFKDTFSPSLQTLGVYTCV